MIHLNFSIWISYVFYLFGTTILCIILNGSYYFYGWYYSNTPSKRQYDYIIVGTGTAGSIIAAKIPSKDVLIVEAGSMRSGLLDVPLLQPLLQGTRYDWQYRTEPQKDACGALVENRSAWPMGKVFGGTHMLNNMIHYRAEIKDFIGWFDREDELQSFLEYFERWGDDAMIPMEQTQFETDLSTAFIKAADQAGLNESLFYRPNVTTKGGRRSTASHHNWQNLQLGHELILNAEVTKIIVQNSKGTGLVINKAGQTYEISAVKGIILAAGTIGSSKILLQSGIGPKLHLIAAGIQPIVDLPVGENLQDHITTGMDLVLLSKRMPMQPMDLIHPSNIWKYLTNRGMNSSLSFGGCECLGFVNLDSSFTHNLGFMVLPVGITIDTGLHLRNLINLREDIWQHYFEPLVNQGQQSVTILPILLHPQSRGHVRIKNNNPHSNLIIEPNYLREKQDIHLLTTGLKILQHILSQPAMRDLGAEINPKPFPGCENIQFGSDSYWECYIRSLTLTLYHPVGTCRMGADHDPEAVVSNKDFKVHKLDNVYVVDGSVMPNLPSGNPNSVVAALANYFLKVNFFNR
ncbi:glucose dehydrogenase [FAD, quinone]-like [Topomyia yanbarensis]|uniref:glucose dehydrogenase [FAD, quinone]-like n=1 Tax=Topomyia yanbarensis TaxID=2498891 RepID=UPI00273BC0E9|nr:glucose dehydrogenase [FAD, quinone]-like [Topomyia yanbarensis]